MGERGRILAGGVLTALVSVSLPAQVSQAADTEGERVHTWVRSDAPTREAPLTPVGDKLWFQSRAGTTGSEPWVSDGTAAGTHLLVDANPGAAWSEPAVLHTTENHLYFRATTPVGPRLWVTDGTTAGTRLVADVPVPPRTRNNVFEAPDGRVYFAGVDGDEGTELWVSDDSVRGARLVADIDPTAGKSSWPWSFGLLGGRVSFAATTETNGTELWTTDGTPEGTAMLVDLDGSGRSTVRSTIVYAGGRAYYVGTREVDVDGVPSADPLGHELWSSDGTADGTGRIGNVDGGSNKSDINDITPFGDRVLFTARTDFRTRAWVSDGTPGGTFALSDLLPVTGSGFSVFGDPSAPRAVIRGATSGTQGIESRTLWSTDGTRAGTTLLLREGGPARGEVEIWPVSSRVLPDGRLLINLGPGSRWWATDGTPEGTVTLSTRHEIRRSLGAVVGRRLYWLETNDDDRLYRLWSDEIDTEFLRPVPRVTLPDRKSQVSMRLMDTQYTRAWAEIAVRSNGVDVPATPEILIDGVKDTDLILERGRGLYWFPEDLRVGPHTVTLNYRGTKDIAPSTSTIKVTVQRSSTSVSGTARTVRADQRPVVKVAATIGRQARAGTVEVRRNGRLLGRVVLNAQNRGTVRLPRMKAGSYRLRLINPGDSLTAPSSKVIRLKVKKARR